MIGPSIEQQEARVTHTPTALPLPETAERVLRFWRDAGYYRWFTNDADFDRIFHDHFLGAHMAAARRELDTWLDTAQACLGIPSVAEAAALAAAGSGSRLLVTRIAVSDATCAVAVTASA